MVYLTNHSKELITLANQIIQISDTKNVGGGYVKGGVNYNINDRQNVFFNGGFISRQPNFDGVFPNYANTVNPDLQNEEIKSVELGYGFISNNFRQM